MKTVIRPFRWLESKLADPGRHTEPKWYDAWITLGVIIGIVVFGFVLAEVLGR